MSVKVYLQNITPKKASELLLSNYEFNRDLDPQKVNQYATEMNNGEFCLSNDAICIDENGKLINGQHRLHAIVKTGLEQNFIISEGMQTSSIKKMDIAKKRNRHGRLKADEKVLPNSSCAHIIENAMAKYEAKAAGPSQFASHNYDDVIYYAYQKHEDFINFLVSHQLTKQSALAGAALLLYVHMMPNYVELENPKERYPHGQNPLERALSFIEICKSGFCKDLPVLAQYDRPAIGIYNLSQTKEWIQMPAQVKYRWYVSAAFMYMCGNSSEVQKPFDSAVFNTFIQYPATAANFNTRSNG